jgi:outer membrane biosynthesis protein TonB
MDRTEKTGIGIAVAGHIALFALLSASLLWRKPPSFSHPPMDVTLSTEAAMESAAPQITQHPAESQAPEVGPPAEAAEAQPAPMTKAEPAPAPPKPKPAPQPKPAEVSKPKPEKQQPAAKPKPQPAPDKAKGTSKASDKPRERGSRLGPNFLKGITAEKSDSREQAPRASKIGAQDIANIAGLIKRQVQPCYDLGALAGTSAMSIVTVLRLQFRQDGSVASATLSRQDGVSGSNRQYSQQMADLSRRAVLRCSPLKGLPPELYKGGWEDIEFTFRPSDFG